jgi:hypothetical protein
MTGTLPGDPRTCTPTLLASGAMFAVDNNDNYSNIYR